MILSKVERKYIDERVPRYDSFNRCVAVSQKACDMNGYEYEFRIK